ncbi:thymidine kinase [Egicoccus sp. AB-alg6-2]|uniref:thymidine kinase n=1 Tax=Egicoccus sp. AB-alg6-2 TaxID=3242692 RepID=UPI00359EF6F9
MAELTYFYGTMNCGKSTLALQIHHNAVMAGKHCLLFTKHDRGGGRISSRIGLAQDAIVVGDHLDIAAYVRSVTSGGEAVDVLICDETQFYSPEQIEQLAWLVDELEIDVQAFGLLTDFATHLFPGSRRLLELADRRQELQVEARCWCGERGTHNARTVGGAIQRQGEQVVVGDLPQASLETGDVPTVAYEVLCRRHHRLGTTRAEADRQPEKERERTRFPVA